MQKEMIVTLAIGIEFKKLRVTLLFPPVPPNSNDRLQQKRIQNILACIKGKYDRPEYVAHLCRGECCLTAVAQKFVLMITEGDITTLGFS